MADTLIYQKGRFPLPFEQRFMDNHNRKFHARNAQYWKGEIEEDIDYVYTNNESVAKAYKAAGAEVFPIPESEREPSKTVPRSVAEPKKTTTRARTAKPKTTTATKSKTTTKRTTTKKS